MIIKYNYSHYLRAISITKVIEFESVDMAMTLFGNLCGFFLALLSFNGCMDKVIED